MTVPNVLINNAIKNLVLTSVLLVSFLFTDCTPHHSYSSVLLDAERIMDEYPDSAYALITVFDTNQIITPADSALYYLLYTQAEIKTDRQVSIELEHLEEASNFFRDSNRDIRRLMLSLLYIGQQLSNLQQYDKAIGYLLEAENIAENLNEYFYLGIIDRRISNIYSEIFSYKLSLKYSEKAIDAFSKTDKNDYWNYERINLACDYIGLDDYEKAKVLLDSVMSVAREMDDSYAMESTDKYYFYVEYRLHNWKAALEHFHKIKNENIEEQFKIYQCAIKCYDNLGMHKEADSLMQKFPENYEEVSTRHEYYASAGKYKDAYIELLKAHRNTNLIVQKLVSQNVTSEVSKYEKVALEHEKYTRTQEHTQWIIFSACFVMLSTIVLMMLVYKRNLRKKELKIIQFDNQILKDEIKRLNESGIRHESKIKAYWKELYHNQFIVIDNLFIEYENATSARKSMTISRNIERTFRTLQDDTSFRTKVFEDINKYHSDLISELENSSLNLSNEELSLLAYMIAGLSNQSMSLLLKLSPNALYTRKNRLKNKIKNMNFSRKQEILALI